MSKETKKGFTIIELLTVMSIIIIIMSILLPALQGSRRFAANVKQKSQFHEISKALEQFEKERGYYPDSDAYDVCTPPVAYCGAMRLCEAVMGQDGMGFHPDSSFTANAGMDPHDTTGTLRKYPFNLCIRRNPDPTTGEPANLRYRESGRYLDVELVKAYRLEDVYGVGGLASGTVSFETDETLYPNSVISDVFLRPIVVNTNCDPEVAGQKVGMPVLYYKADTSRVDHIADNTIASYPLNNIYRYTDNDDLVNLGFPWEPIASRTIDIDHQHPLSSNYEGVSGVTPGTTFYQDTRNERITSVPKPHNEGKYILISAGWDGLYGTSDDVTNFTD